MRHPYYQTPRDEQREAFIEEVRRIVAERQRTIPADRRILQAKEH